MFSTVGDFVKRHRKKLIFGGLVAAGVYGVSRYNAYIHRIQDEQRKNLIERIKREQHFESILTTSNTTIENASKDVRRILLESLDVKELLERARAKPDNRIEIWEEIKIRLITFGVTTMYAEVLLICAFRIQFGIIGGQILSATAKADKVQVQDIHKRYLNMIQHFLNDGLAELIRVVKHAVVASFGHIELQQMITSDDFLLSYNFVKNNVAIIENASSFLMINQWTVESCSKDSTATFEILNQMTSETKDILQCSDCLAVLENLVSDGMRHLNQTVQFSFAMTGRDKCAMAKLLPALKAQTEFREGDFIRNGLASGSSKNFLANVYEAFCNNPK